MMLIKITKRKYRVGDVQMHWRGDRPLRNATAQFGGLRRLGGHFGQGCFVYQGLQSHAVEQIEHVLCEAVP